MDTIIDTLVIIVFEAYTPLAIGSACNSVEIYVSQWWHLEGRLAGIASVRVYITGETNRTPMYTTGGY